MSERRLKAVYYGGLMFTVTAGGVLGLAAHIQMDDMPMVVMFSIATPIAAAMTVRIFYVAMYGDSPDE